MKAKRASSPTLFNPADLVPKGSWRPPESLPELGAYKHLSLDVETDGKDKQSSRPCGISLCTPDRKRYYLPYAHLGGGNLDKGLIKRWAMRELRDKLIINLNTGFDSECLLNDGIDLEGQGCRLRDVAHSAALLDEHRYGGFNLNNLGKEYVGREKTESPVPIEDLYKHHSSQAGPYAEDDAELALDVYDKQEPQLAAEGLQAVQQLEDDLIYVNNHMERSGARLDAQKLRRWCVEAKERQQQATIEIYRLTGLKINPNSPQDMTKLFNQLGLVNDVRTGQGGWSFTKEILHQYDHPVVRLVEQVRNLDSLRSKYLDKYYKHLDGGDILKFHLYQLRAGEDDYGTVSGRYSSANVNIQQVFKGEKQQETFGGDYIIRELFIPDEGMDLFAGDASQIEFRLFGHYSGSKMIIGSYAKNPWVDFHEMVAQMLGQKRSEAKHNNFGKIYGMGRRKMCRRLGLACVCGCPDDVFWNNDAHEANCPAIKGNIIINAYDEKFPEAKKLMRRTMDVAGERGYVKTVLGRRARFPTGEKMHAALNRIIQGGAADLFKMKIRRIYRERNTIGIHKLRMPVHDEEVGDIQKGDGPRKRLIECFQEQEMELKVPILWDIEFGNNWLECA